MSDFVKLVLSIILFLALSNPLYSKIGKYPVKNFTPNDYKAGIQNIDFAQNGDMTLFVANNLGILSFNGTRWTTHARNTGIKQRSLIFDNTTNRLYAGSQGEFGYYSDNWKYISLSSQLSEDEQNFDEVWDVFIINSKVYFCTFQGLFMYDGEKLTRLEMTRGFNRSFFTNNRLFTQTSDGKLYEVINDKLVDNVIQNINGQIVAGVITHNSGLLIFYNSGDIEFTTPLGAESIYPDLANTLTGKYINHVLRLSDSRLVISTQQSGLYLFDESSNFIKNISKAEGLESNACLRAYQDYTGNLWVGMQNGIALIDINSPMRLVNSEVNLEGSGYDVYYTSNGTYYTTSNGIYYKSNTSQTSVFLNGTEGPAYSITLIANTLYAGHHTGLFILENTQAKRVATTEGLWEVKRLASNPRYAIGGGYSGLHLFQLGKDEKLELVKKLEGFNETSRFFEEDRMGKIWIGQFYKGLYSITMSKDMTISTVDKVSDQYADIPIQDHIILSNIDNAIYIGTERGVYQINEISGEIERSKLFNDIIGEHWVYLLAQDDQKNVHVYTEDHVGFFKKIGPENYAYASSSLFQLQQNFNNDLLSLSCKVPEGVFYNANEGFIYYQPTLEDRLIIENTPIIKKVYSVTEDTTVFHRTTFQARDSQPERIIISESHQVLQFTVESFKYRDINNSQFRYFLKGFDRDYSEWTTTDIKEYTNLKASDYEFYVQTVNSLGEVVTSQPLYIKVTPTFFNSPMAKSIYFILALMVLYQLYRFQRGYYRSKTTKITKAKEAEINKKKVEVQQLKDAQNESELRHLNNLLAASTMNLVVKNEFMENIKEEIKEVKKEGNDEQTQKALTRIVKEIDTTLKVQEDWQQFEYHFDRVHGDFLNRLTNEFRDLTPGEQKLCAFLRLKMDTKEIANLLGISLRGVEVARYRLRKKLNLTKEQNLSKFILEY